ncbi:MAG TPA: rod shape-determining protein MreD [Thiothrix sp.]|nr:rod shape-determining protein MreD [Thiothrix sp.]
MEQLSLRFSGAILTSLFVALILSLIPLPEPFSIWQPEWVALAVIHWGILFPKTSSYIVVFITGLLIDSLSGTLLGQHSLGLVVVLYITLSLNRRLSAKTLMQQVFIILFAIGSYLAINYFMLNISHSKPKDWYYWAPLLSSIVAWPIAHRLLSMLHTSPRGL